MTAKTISDIAPMALDKDLTLCVSTTGSGNNNGLTTELAKRTIQAAIDSVPKNLGGHSVIIEIADGDYTNEHLSLYGFFEGSCTNGNTPDFLLKGSSRAGTVIGAVSAVLPGIRGGIINLSVSAVNFASGAYWVGHCRIWNVNVNVIFDGYAYGVVFGDCFIIWEDICCNAPSAAAATPGVLYINGLSGISETAVIAGGSSPFAQPAFVIINNNTVVTDVSKYMKLNGAVIFENGALVA